MVLSKINATQPPTNMAVVRRTFNTWSMPVIPRGTERKKKLVFEFLTYPITSYSFNVGEL